MKKRLKKNLFQKKRKLLVFLLTLCLMMMAMPNTVWAKTDGTEEITEETLEEITEKDPEEITEETPEEITEEDPEEITEKDPNEITEEDPNEITEEDPKEITEKNPEEITEEDPNEITEKNPEEIMEENPNEITEENEETLAVDDPIVQVLNIVGADDDDVVAYQDTVEYQIWVGGVQVTSNNVDNVLAGGDNDRKVSYNPDTNTLTLNGANISCDSQGKGSLRSEEDGLTVELLGTNTINDESTSGDNGEISSVYSAGALTFRGGSLEITGPSEITDCDLYVINCKGNLDIDSVSLTVTSGKTKGNALDSIAITCDIDNPTLTLTINNSTVNAVSDGADWNGGSYAILGSKLELRNSTVIAKGGESGGGSFGIDLFSNIELYNSEIIAEAGDSNGVSDGICGKNLLLDAGSKLTAKGGCSRQNGSGATGLYISGNITLNGGTIIADSGTSAVKNYGIDCKNLEVNNGNITATGWDEFDYADSRGLYVDDTFTLNGGMVRATGGQNCSESMGLYAGKIAKIFDGELIAIAGYAGESTGLYVDETFTLSGGSVRVEATRAEYFCGGLMTENVEIFGGKLVAIAGDSDTGSSYGLAVVDAVTISGGKLVAIAGQAGSYEYDGVVYNGERKAISLAPNIAEDYEGIVKAGNSEEDAAVIEFPTNEEYWCNAYVSIGLDEDDENDDKPGGNEDSGNGNGENGVGSNSGESDESSAAGGDGSNDGGSDESSAAGGDGSNDGESDESAADGNSSSLSNNSNGRMNTAGVPVNNASAADSNKKDDVPNTGDNTSGSWIWLWLALAASVAGAGIFLTGKRQVIIKMITADRNEAKKQG